MVRPADVVCAVAVGPASALLAIVAGTVVGLLGDGTADTAILFGAALFVAPAPATIALRARVSGLTLGSTCLLLLITIISMAATLSALVLALSLTYAHFMGDF